jgi:hypothetical protein
MRSAKTLEELRGFIGHVLDEASRSDAQMVGALLKRVNGSANLKQILTAALSVARDSQNARIAELEQERDDAVLDRDDLEGELRDLHRKLDALIVRTSNREGT